MTDTLCTTAAINTSHQMDIAKIQEWLGQANISTPQIYDHRKLGQRIARC